MAPRDTPTPGRRNGEDTDAEDYPTPPPQRPSGVPGPQPLRNPPSD